MANRIGTNTSKLKIEFKAQFGVPVFKYLQNERLKKAYNLIKNEQKTIQEAAWAVGYDSLGSFSNAFERKFGYRPSKVQNSFRINHNSYRISRWFIAAIDLYHNSKNKNYEIKHFSYWWNW